VASVFTGSVASPRVQAAQPAAGVTQTEEPSAPLERVERVQFTDVVPGERLKFTDGIPMQVTARPMGQLLSPTIAAAASRGSTVVVGVVSRAVRCVKLASGSTRERGAKCEVEVFDGSGEGDSGAWPRERSWSFISYKRFVQQQDARGEAWESPRDALSFDAAVAWLDARNMTDDSAVVPFVRSMPFSVQGVPGLFAMAVFDGLAVAAAVALLALALKSGFWTEKKSFIALLGVLVVGMAIGVPFWTFLGNGYVGIGASDVNSVPKVAVDILDRVVQVVFVLLFAMFACIMIAAALGTFYPDQTKLPKISLVAFGVATLGTVVYSMTMAIIHALAPNGMGFVVDVSNLLLPAVSVLFAVVLSVLWLLVWRMVTAEKAARDRCGSMLSCPSSRRLCWRPASRPNASSPPCTSLLTFARLRHRCSCCRRWTTC
jgi:hypothetical protein